MRQHRILWARPPLTVMPSVSDVDRMARGLGTRPLPLLEHSQADNLFLFLQVKDCRTRLVQTHRQECRLPKFRTATPRSNERPTTPTCNT